MLRSACCDAPIVCFDCCGDCKEHCDVYCTECEKEFPNGTETCPNCEYKPKTFEEVREYLGLGSKE